MTERELEDCAVGDKLSRRSIVAGATFFGAAMAAIEDVAKAQNAGSGSYSNAEANRRMRRSGSLSVRLAPSGTLEHLCSRFDNVLDHPVGGEGRERFTHGALHSGDFVAEFALTKMSTSTTRVRQGVQPGLHRWLRRGRFRSG